MRSRGRRAGEKEGPLSVCLTVRLLIRWNTRGSNGYEDGGERGRARDDPQQQHRHRDDGGPSRGIVHVVILLFHHGADGDPDGEYERRQSVLDWISTTKPASGAATTAAAGATAAAAASTSENQPGHRCSHR